LGHTEKVTDVPDISSGSYDIKSATNAISKKTRRGRPKGSSATPRATLELIDNLARAYYTAAEVESILKMKLGDETPSLRMIRDRVSRHRPRDLSEPWTFGDTDPEHDRVVLNVRGGAREATGGRVQQLTIEEGRFAVHIGYAAADLDPQTQWWLVRLYTLRANQPRLSDRVTTDLDGYLEYRPWSSTEAQRKYDSALARGFFPPLPLGLYEGLERFTSYGDFDEAVTYGAMESPTFEEVEHQLNG